MDDLERRGQVPNELRGKVDELLAANLIRIRSVDGEDNHVKIVVLDHFKTILSMAIASVLVLPLLAALACGLGLLLFSNWFNVSNLMKCEVLFLVLVVGTMNSAYQEPSVSESYQDLPTGYCCIGATILLAEIILVMCFLTLIVS